jgi:cytochrome P450
MSVVSRELDELVRIEDPDFYIDPFDVFRRLQRECPVYWYEPLETWVLTKYEDIRYVGRTPEIFSNEDGILLNDIRYGNITNSFFPEGGELISTLDPPRHRELRRYIAPTFVPSSIKELEDTVRRFARELIDTIVPGEPIEFVRKIGAVLPLKTIAVVLGIPGDNIDELMYFSDEGHKKGSTLTRDELATAASNSNAVLPYFHEWIIRNLGKDSRELIPTLVNAKLAGKDISFETLQTFLLTVLGAGNQTTRDYVAGSVWSFAQHPEQRARLVADLALMPNAVEECLRWVTPVRGFIRTVRQDTEIRGQAIERGHHVQMMWMAANRDEDVWDHADVFDIAREPDPLHLAFGFGEHACPGSAVARLEHRVFFEELLPRYPQWDIAGEPVRPYSVLHNKFEELPVVFHPAEGSSAKG